MIYKDFKKVQFVERRNAIIIGRTGVGKSGIYGCLIGILNFQTFGLRAGTEKTISKTIQDDDYTIHLVDTIGWSGNEKEDLELFKQLREELKDDSAKINRIFFVITAKRFTKVDQSIVDFLQRHSSPKMKDLIHVVVTHAPAFEQTNDLMDLMKEKFSFLLKDPNDEDEFKSKFTFVDLLDSRRFEQYPDTLGIVTNEWNTYRDHLLNIIKESSDDLSVRKFIHSSEVFTWMRLQSFAIVLSLLILIILVLIGVLRHYFQINITLVEQNQNLQERVETLLANVTTSVSNGAGLIYHTSQLLNGIGKGWSILTSFFTERK